MVMTVVTLPRKVPRGVAIHAARMTYYREHLLECRHSSGVVTCRRANDTFYGLPPVRGCNV
jgi:hypothetical protein